MFNANSPHVLLQLSYNLTVGCQKPAHSFFSSDVMLLFPRLCELSRLISVSTLTPRKWLQTISLCHVSYYLTACCRGRPAAHPSVQPPHPHNEHRIVIYRRPHWCKPYISHRGGRAQTCMLYSHMQNSGNDLKITNEQHLFEFRGPSVYRMMCICEVRSSPFSGVCMSVNLHRFAYRFD